MLMQQEENESTSQGREPAVDGDTESQNGSTPSAQVHQEVVEAQVQNKSTEEEVNLSKTKDIVEFEEDEEDSQPVVEAAEVRILHPPGLEPPGVPEGTQLHEMKQEAARHTDLVDAIEEVAEKMEKSVNKPDAAWVREIISEFALQITARYQTKRGIRGRVEQPACPQEAEAAGQTHEFAALESEEGWLKVEMEQQAVEPCSDKAMAADGDDVAMACEDAKGGEGTVTEEMQVPATKAGEPKKLAAQKEVRLAELVESWQVVLAPLEADSTKIAAQSMSEAWKEVERKQKVAQEGQARNAQVVEEVCEELKNTKRMLEEIMVQEKAEESAADGSGGGMLETAQPLEDGKRDTEVKKSTENSAATGALKGASPQKADTSPEKGSVSEGIEVPTSLEAVEAFNRTSKFMYTYDEKLRKIRPHAKVRTEEGDQGHSEPPIAIRIDVPREANVVEPMQDKGQSVKQGQVSHQVKQLESKKAQEAKATSGGPKSETVIRKDASWLNPMSQAERCAEAEEEEKGQRSEPTTTEPKSEADDEWVIPKHIAARSSGVQGNDESDTKLSPQSPVEEEGHHLSLEQAPQVQQRLDDESEERREESDGQTRRVLEDEDNDELIASLIQIEENETMATVCVCGEQYEPPPPWTSGGCPAEAKCPLLMFGQGDLHQLQAYVSQQGKEKVRKQYPLMRLEWLDNYCAVVQAKQKCKWEDKELAEGQQAIPEGTVEVSKPTGIEEKSSEKREVSGTASEEQATRCLEIRSNSDDEVSSADSEYGLRSGPISKPNDADAALESEPDDLEGAALISEKVERAMKEVGARSAYEFVYKFVDFESVYEAYGRLVAEAWS